MIQNCEESPNHVRCLGIIGRPNCTIRPFNCVIIFGCLTDVLSRRRSLSFSTLATKSQILTPKEYYLFRVNPHLTLRVRQAIAHVTPRRSAHPHFTSTLPNFTGLHCALSTASPLLTRLAWFMLIPGLAAIESVNS